MLETLSIPARVLPNGGIDLLRPMQDWVNPTMDVVVLAVKPMSAEHALPTKLPVPGDPAAFVQALKNRPFPAHLRRSTAEIQQQIQEERDAWD